MEFLTQLELAQLKTKVTMLEGFINYHFGESWRKWQDAVELSKHKLAVKPSDPYVAAEG